MGGFLGAALGRNRHNFRYSALFKSITLDNVLYPVVYRFFMVTELRHIL